MPQFTRLAEIGRVCLITYGSDRGKLCVIVNIVDENRALIAPVGNDLRRQSINFKRLQLTDFLINIGIGAGKKVIDAALDADFILAKWDKSEWAKKLASKEKRNGATDFDRFKIMVARQSRAAQIRKAVNSL